MTSTISTSPAAERSRSPNFAILLGLAWLVIVVQLLADHWAETARTLSDMDDAMRLVGVREFMAGRGWFDLHEARLGPPGGYDTHWSRLIDVGIAALIIGFERITDSATAERLARVLWPMLWLVPAVTGAALIAWRIAGRVAATIVLLLAMLGLPAYAHFVPGRIDHHNVQIALAILIMAAAAWSDRVRFAAGAAGVLTGIAMAIGLESGPYVVLGGAVLALRFVASRDGAQPLAIYGTCAAVAVSAAFLVSVAPAQWAGKACDAIAINSVVAVVIATGGLAIGARLLAGANWRGRLAAIAGAGAAAATAYFAMDPQCLHGPFGSIDPTVRALWFVHVSEMQPLWTVAAASPAMAAAVAAFPAVALVCVLALSLEPEMRGDFGFLVAASALVLSIVVMAVMVRAMSYAVWLALPITAVGAQRLAGALRWRCC
jgi:hypothetical protein